MITIEDKLNLFAGIVLDKAEKESAEKVDKAFRSIDEKMAAEKQSIDEECALIIEESAIKAQAEYTRIISKAKQESKQKLLAKRNELLERTIADLRVLADTFAGTGAYAAFLEKSIYQAAGSMKGEKELRLYFTSRDLKAHQDLIRRCLGSAVPDAAYTLLEADDGILGGCICVNGKGTRKAEHTLASLLEDGREIIGQTVTEYLHI
ncbi:MAG TPA: V-type ATP synthase subunit E family protein [Candidatus Atribacteria bacterium]|nr:V-type ATP synthase subunit E family protein [Candidatus Atribacteria bacterium]